jgi:hypothetical protein
MIFLEDGAGSSPANDDAEEIPGALRGNMPLPGEQLRDPWASATLAHRAVSPQKACRARARSVRSIVASRASNTRRAW